MSNQKQTYSSPQIEQLKLDNEISLVLQSSPPAGPDEVQNTSNSFINDPFKTNYG